MFVRRIDDLGRISIPMELRKAMHIEPGDDCDIIPDCSSIVIQKHFDNILEEIKLKISLLEDVELKNKLFDIIIEWIKGESNTK